MGQMRSDWVAAKKTLDTAKIDTKKFFKEDLGPALDAFDKADDQFDNISGTAKPQVIDAAKKARKAAAEKAYKICSSYISAVKLFETGIKDPTQRKALDNALTVLSMKIFKQLDNVIKGKGAGM